MPEPSRLAPMFVAPVETPPEAEPAPLTDDIPEVPVPAPVMAAIAPEASPPLPEHGRLVDATMTLLEGKITEWVSGQSTATLKVLDQVYAHVASCLDKIAVANDHAQYQLATALDRLGERGVQVHGTPYTATVQATTPQGFPLILTLHKGSAEELVQALDGLTQWLQSQGYLGALTPMRTVPALTENDGIPF